MKSILVLDNLTPWIRNMFQVLPAGWSARFLGPRSLGLSPSAWWSAITKATAFEDSAPVIGWNRAFGLSTRMFARAIRKAVNKQPAPQAIVHSIPWTAGVIDWFPNIPHVYRAHDFFGNYDWDQSRVVELERQMQHGCRLSLPLTELHAADLRQLGPAPVQALGCGVSSEFVRRFRGSTLVAPEDLPTGKPIVGCVGQINMTYDFELIERLADAFPNVWFVFIGPIFKMNEQDRQIVDTVFSRPNIRWLGPKPHATLPDYMAQFTVCINPLRKMPANDRRSQLRLFDYLAAEKPVISSDLTDARNHRQYLMIARDIDHFIESMNAVLSGQVRIDQQSVRDYIDAQTWEVRAATFVREMQSFCISAT